MAHHVHQYGVIIKLLDAALRQLDSSSSLEFKSSINRLLFLLNSVPISSTHKDKLTVYHLVFRISSPRSSRSLSERCEDTPFANMMHRHVLDVWRMALLQLSVEVHRLIFDHLLKQVRDRGKRIQHYQAVLSRKNTTLRQQQGIVKMLGDRTRLHSLELEKEREAVDQSYEMVMPRPFSMIGYWFSG